MHFAAYDVAVASWLGSVVAPDDEGSGFPGWVGATWTRRSVLRYGENAHQRAALYGSIQGGGIAQADIARIFGVPPHKIGILDRATNNNIEHQGIDYVTGPVSSLAKIKYTPVLTRSPLMLVAGQIACPPRERARYTRLPAMSVMRTSLSATSPVMATGPV